MTEIDPEILQVAREEANDRLQRIEETLLAIEAGSIAGNEVDVLFREAHSIKGAAGMVGWEETSAIAHAMEDVLAEIRERGVFPPELVEPLLGATDALRRSVAGEAGLASAAVGELRRHAAPSPPPSNGGPEPSVLAQPARTNGVTPQSLRVSAEKVDRMVDAVGEAVLHRRRLEHTIGERLDVERDDQLDEELDTGDRLLDELQDSVLRMRTLPISSITASFPRAVRDLAASEGKQVELDIGGAETQLDRAILNGISDTIVHLLRNAVAHGIEPPAERERAGKPPCGRVELRAEPRGEMVAVEVADDGRGVAPELLARAGETVPLADILSTAGVSTAREVSEVAGRGVGLDAVRGHVESLGGSLEVRSEAGTGTRVILLLPLTLSILNVLLFERGGQMFGIPMASVSEVVTVTRAVSLEGLPSLELRGKSIPLRDLAPMIGATAPELPERPPALILSAPGTRLAVSCDSVVGEEEAVTKGLGPLLAAIPGYLGAAILSDGRVALILDPNHLLKMPSRAARAGARPVAPSTPAPAPKLLVVDDQFTVRELQRSILEAAGYRVDTARDGRDALDHLAADPEIDLVLSDLDMPEVDGLALLGSIRADDKWASLPVVIVTAQGSEEDKQRGAEAGADAYVVKDEFDQHALLETVARLVGR